MSARAALLALALASCGRDAEHAPGDDPYRVQIDVAPQIRALGEETITADEAAEQLEQMGPGVIPALSAALAREPKDIRQKAVEILTAIGTGEAVPTLLHAAEHDADEDVRADALRGLGAIRDERGLPAVEAALADPRLTIRVGGIMGCAGFCTRPETIERLADIAVRDENAAVALSARTTLAAIGAQGPGEQEKVRAAIDRRRPSTLPPASKADERALAALLASDVDGAAGIPALIAALGAASPALQRQVIWRLGIIGDERAVPALRPQLEAKDPMVQAYAYDALVKLRDHGIRGADAAAAAHAGPKPRGPLGSPEF